MCDLILLCTPGEKSVSEAKSRRPRSESPHRSVKRSGAFLGKGFGQQIAKTKGEQRRSDANFWKAAKQGNKSFILKGRGSSVVEQPIRKLRQPALNKQDSSRIQQLSCPSQPITTHHFRSYNAKTTQEMWDVDVSCVLHAAVAPQIVCAAFPLRSGCLYFRRSFAYLTGTARFEPPKSLSTAKFMPITFPSRLKSGPPEPPEVVAAS